MSEKSASQCTYRDLQPKIVQTKLGTIEFVDFGQGPVVLAIHGAMGGYDQSAILADTVLTGGYRVIAVSRPGYLGTPLASGRSPVQQADLLAALLDELKIDSVSVLAISGGGPSAISFALGHGQRCRALGLISTVSGKNVIPIPFRFQILKFLSRIPPFVSSMRKKTAADTEKVAERSITDAALRAQMLADNPARALFEALGASTFHRMSQRFPGTDNDIEITRTTEYPLENIATPTLIIHGDCDPLVNFAAHAQSALKRIPNAELLVLEGGEHAAIFTHRRLVQDRLAAFLAQHAAK